MEPVPEVTGPNVIVEYRNNVLSDSEMASIFQFPHLTYAESLQVATNLEVKEDSDNEQNSESSNSAESIEEGDDEEAELLSTPTPEEGYNTGHYQIRAFFHYLDEHQRQQYRINQIERLNNSSNDAVEPITIYNLMRDESESEGSETETDTESDAVGLDEEESFDSDSVYESDDGVMHSCYSQRENRDWDRNI